MSSEALFDLVRFCVSTALLVVLIVLVRHLRVRTKVLDANAARLEATVDRMEAETKNVAENLKVSMQGLIVAAEQRIAQGRTIDRMEAATIVVAENLADSVSRADATNGQPGEAADAALRTRDTAEDITKRQGKSR